jgi:hypothetical protein
VSAGPDDRSRNLRAVAITAFGLVLPSLLASVALPGVDLDGWHQLFGMEARVDASLTLGALLMVPWVQTALLVHALAWLVPPWRRTVRSTRVARNLARTSWGAGVFALLAQSLALTRFFREQDMVVNDTWAPWAIGGSILVVSLGARLWARLITRQGLGDGLSVMIAGELLLRLAQMLRQSGLAEGLREGATPFTLTMLLALLGTLGLAIWLSGWVRPKLRARWDVLPMTTPSGLLPAGLAAASMAAMAAPAHGVLATRVDPAWLSAWDMVFGMPLQCPLPVDSELALGATAMFSIAVALLVTRPGALDRVLSTAGIGQAEGRSWFWVATFANATFQLLLVRAATLTWTRSLLPWLCVTAFVLHDVWMEWQLKTAGEALPAAQLNSVVSARVASHTLAAAGISHALRGLALRALFHGLVPFTEIEVLVGAGDVERAAAELAPLIEADHGRALPRTR